MGREQPTELFCERYQIQRQLGKKAGRRTLLARDIQTQEFVVLKLLTFGSDFEWETLKLFEREAKTLRNLSHSAIPRYLDYFELDLPEHKGFALVQSYIDAPSVEEALKAGRIFNEAELQQLATALLDVLIYLHGQQPPVIHRDLKPSNILLTNRSGNRVGDVYVVDFGSVQTLAAREGGTITVVGTYGYMPPEQFGGRAVPASDLYSLGATLIYLATGIQPAELVGEDLQLEFEANISPAFANWLRWMTQASLKNRLSRAVDAKQALLEGRDSPLISLAEQPPLQFLKEKPCESQIALSKTADELDILFPAEKPSGLGCLFFFAVCWGFVVIPATISAFSSGNLFAALCLLLFFDSTLLFMVWGFIFGLFGQTRLRIDRKNVIFSWELFGFKFSRSRPRHSINKIVRTWPYYQKDNEGTPTKVESKIIIQTKTQKYQLPKSSESELDWLGYELSEWIGLPIVRDWE